LLHANVTEQMCRAWMRSIIHTFCVCGDLASDYSINPMGFCLMATIPDLWLRTQTSRATDLICSLNSKNSAAGSSTLARFCACMKSPDPTSAAKKFSQRKRLPNDSGVRMVSTLKYLQSLDIKIISHLDHESVNLEVFTEIRNALSRIQPGKKVIA